MEKRLGYIYSGILLAVMVCSMTAVICIQCNPKAYVPYQEIKHDTVYVNSAEDNVVIADADVPIRVRIDTVYVPHDVYRYRTITKHDTVYETTAYAIPVEPKVVTVRDTVIVKEKNIRVAYAILWIVFCVFVISAFIYIINKEK